MREGMRSEEMPRDVGTLWTMQRDGHTARCGLFACPQSWELRVIVDGDTMLTERCERSDEAFALAERWKARLSVQLWRQVVPGRSMPETSRLSGPSL